jgi:hypothetical protein
LFVNQKIIIAEKQRESRKKWNCSYFDSTIKLELGKQLKNTRFQQELLKDYNSIEITEPIDIKLPIIYPSVKVCAH